MKEVILSHYQRAREVYKKYERFLMPAMLLGGFLTDYITFTSIQISTTFILLLGYWVFAGAVIAFTHLYDAQKIPPFTRLQYVRLFSPLLIQFAFGSLLGSSLIFYWFSGALSISWPVMAILVLLLVFNETFRSYFERPLVHIGVYFFATISLFSVLLPFLFSSLSAWLFVLAAAGSLAIFSAYIIFLVAFADYSHIQARWFFAVIIAITCAMNALYFANIIPPIPLALREAGLYYNLQLVGNKYVMQGEQAGFLTMVKTALFGQSLHILGSERVYLYTAIFAPAKLQTTIVHHWQYYDQAQKKWIDKGKLPFTINGGRQSGYKSYSWQSNLAAGKWRVYVENLRGQVLGKVRFTITQVSAPVPVQSVTR